MSCKHHYLVNTGLMVLRHTIYCLIEYLALCMQVHLLLKFCHFFMLQVNFPGYGYRVLDIRKLVSLSIAKYLFPENVQQQRYPG